MTRRYCELIVKCDDGESHYAKKESDGHRRLIGIAGRSNDQAALKAPLVDSARECFRLRDAGLWRIRRIGKDNINENINGNNNGIYPLDIIQFGQLDFNRISIVYPVDNRCFLKMIFSNLVAGFVHSSSQQTLDSKVEKVFRIGRFKSVGHMRRETLNFQINIFHPFKRSCKTNSVNTHKSRFF